MENPLLQAAIGGLILFLLVGLLVIRGKSNRIKDAANRQRRAEELHQLQGRLQPSSKGRQARHRSHTGADCRLLSTHRCRHGCRMLQMLEVKILHLHIQLWCM